jgi:hypothetical protein
MKRRWTYLNNCLAGLPWPLWRRLRRENAVGRGYGHRAAFLTAASLRNSLFGRLEERRFGEAIRKTRIDEEPVFVLGHWRSGTTLLHDLLACDVDRFAFPNSLQALFPGMFLLTEEFFRKAFSGWLPRTRPMDNVVLTLETPQEDEFALCSASLLSPYPGMSSFPSNAARYDPYLTLRDVSEGEREQWKETLLWFMRKLTLKYGRPLLLKSPTHTARVRLLLELFPRARFLHVHRHPYQVFQSTQHLYRSLWPLHILEAPPAEFEVAILRRYRLLYDAYFEERSLIPEGRLHEIRYDQLAEDPLGQLRTAYEHLGLDGFEAVRPRLQVYVDARAGYRRNEFPPLVPAARQRIAAAWRASFEEWSYAP